jgi:hypothetical protein
MSQETYFTMGMGALALMVQFAILRFSGEKQRIDGRILYLLGKLAERDLKAHEELRDTVRGLFKQKSTLRLANIYTGKEAMDSAQRSILETIHYLEKRRVHLDHMIIALFIAMSVFLAVLIYLIFKG